MKKIFLFLFILIAAHYFFTSYASSAGFNCEKASTKIEKMICANKELSKLDERLDRLYKQALRSGGNKERIKNEQIDWLKNVRNKCNTEWDLKKVYQKRNSELYKEIVRNNPKKFSFERYIGIYRQPGFTSCFKPGTDGEEIISKCQIEDIFFIKKVDDKTYFVGFSVFGANYHFCQMEGNATPNENRLEHHYKTDYGECLLIIEFEDDEIVLRGDKQTLGCKQYFCGKRAGYDGHRFNLTEKTDQ